MKEKVIKYIKRFHSAVVIIALCFLLDFITKQLTVKYLYHNSKVIIDGFFSLTYCENTGAAWSMFSGEMTVFIIISIIATGIFIYYLKYYDLKKYPFLSLGIALMFGGMLGNFFDRLTKGYVVDFLDFNIFGYDYPVFNVADICLVVGVIALIVHLLVSIKDEKKKQAELAKINEDKNIEEENVENNDSQEVNE